MTVTKLFPSGAYEVAAMVDGFRVSRVYYFVTRAQALRAFVADMREGF